MGDINDKLLSVGIALEVQTKESLKNIESAIKDLESKLDGVKFEPKSFEIVKLDNTGFKLKIKDVQNTLYTLQNTFENFNKDGTLNFNVGTSSLEKSEAVINRFGKSVDTIRAKIENLKVSPNLDTTSVESSYLKLNNQISALKEGEDSLTKAHTNNINSEISDINNQINALQNLQSEYEKSAKYQEQLKQKFGDISGSAIISGNGLDTDSIKSISSAIGVSAENIKQAKVVYDSAGQAWTKYIYQVKNSDGTVSKITASLNQNNNEIRKNVELTKSATVETSTWLDRLKNKTKEIMYYFSASALIYAFFNQIKNGISIIMEINSEMTELRKVTDETEQSYAKFETTASNIGTAIGRTIPEVIRATTEFAKLGYALSDATKLAEKSLVMQNIGDGISQEGAIEAIVASLKGFDMDGVGENVVDNSQKIIDSINEVSNKFAVSTTDIAEAIKRASATLNQSDTDFDHTIGLLTGAIEVLQDAETASTGLVVVSQRIRGIGEAGESLEGLTPKLEKLFNSKGLTMLTDTGDLKNTYEILKDVHSVWSSLTSVEQQYWGEQLAGKNRIKVLNAMLQNWESIESAVKASADSEGSAFRENEAYLNSIQGKIAQFKVATQSMWTNTISSETIKTFVELGTKLINLIDDVGLAKVAFSALGTILIIHSGILGKTKAIYTAASEGQTILGASSKALSAAFTGLNAKAILATAGVEILKASLSFGISFALETIISLLVNLGNNVESASDKIQKADDLFNKFKDDIDDISNNQKAITDLQSDFDKLSQGVDDYGRNVSLTADEYEKYQSIIQKITNINPELISGYDEEGNILAKKNGLIETSIDLLKDEYNQKVKNLSLPDSVNTTIDGAVNRYKKAKAEYEKITLSDDLAFSGKKLTDNGIESGYTNQIDKYIGDVIGKERKEWESLNEYILNNHKVIFENLDKIKERASQNVGGWQGLNKDEIQALTTYFNEMRVAISDMDDASTSANGTLQYVAMAEDSYQKLSDSQKNFVTTYINGLKVTSSTTETEKEHIRKSIISLVDTISEEGNKAGGFINQLFALDKTQIPYEEYRKLAENLISQITDALNLKNDDPIITNLKIALNIDDNDILNQIKKKLASLNLSDKNNMLSTLKLSDLQIIFKLLNDPNGDYSSFNDVIRAYNTTKETTEKPIEFNIDANKDAIDKFQKSMTSIKTALSDEDLDSSKLIDLMQEYYDFDWEGYGVTGEKGIGKINEALKALALQQFSTVQSTDSTSQAFKEMYLDAVKVSKSTLSVSSAVTSLDKFSTALSNVSTAYTDLKSKQQINSSTLSDIQAQFADTQSIEKFIRIVSSSKSITKDVQSAFNDLVTEYLNTSDVLENLNDSTKDVIISQLKHIGVENADEVVTKKLNEQKQILAETGLDIRTATEAEIISLLNEKDVSDKTRTALSLLALQKIGVNNVALSSDGDIKNLLSLMATANATSKSLQILEAYKSGKVKMGGTRPEDMENILKNAQAEADAFYKGLNKSVDYQVKYTGSKEKVKSTKGSQSKFSNQIDFAAEKVKILESEIDKLNSKLNNTTSLEKQTNIYNELISKQKELSETYKKTASTYENEFEKALSKLSKSDQSKVKNGSYSVEQFTGKGQNSSEEKHYNAITKAIDLREKLADANKNVIDSETKLNQFIKSLVDLRWDKASKSVELLNNEISLLEKKLDNTDSFDEKNKLLDKILTKQKEIISNYAAAISATKTDVGELYNKIDKSLRVNGNNKKVSSGSYISTKGVVDKEQLSLIKEYNAFVKELKANVKLLNAAEEDYKSELNDKKKQKYDNSKAKYDNQLALLNNSKQNIQNAIEEVNSLNGSANAEQYNELISLNDKEIEYYSKKKSLAEDTIKKEKVGSERYNELSSDIQDCNDAISSAKQEQYAWNKAIIELPISQLEKANDELEYQSNQLKAQLDIYDKVINAVTTMLDNQIDSYELQKDAVEESYNNQIQLIKDKVEALKQENDAHKKQIDLEKAQYELERAKNQKTNMVYREGQGFTYEADMTSVHEAQNTLDNLVFDSIIDAKEAEIDSLEKAKDSAVKGYEAQIKYLQTIKKQWEDIADIADNLSNINLANSYLGSDWQSKILGGDTQSLNYIKSMYVNVDGQISNLEAQIKANELQIESIKKLSQAWSDAQLAIQKATDKIESKVTDNKKELDALDVLKDASTKYATEWVTSKDTILSAHQEIVDSNASARDTEADILNSRISNLHNFATEVSSIASSVSSALTSILSKLDVARSANAEISSSSPSVTNNSKATNTTPKKATKSHSGMELGYIGDESSSKDAFRYIALDKLKPDEIVKVLQKGEGVTTLGQQSNILSNMTSAFKAGVQVMASKIADNRSSVMQPAFSIGTIHLHEVNDVEGLTNALITDFLPKMNQKLHK